MTFDLLADMVRGTTFDDFILRPQHSIVERRDPSVIDLSCRFSTHITLKRPLVSANMDTVTRAPMARVQAEEGGLGIIDRGFQERRHRAASARGGQGQADAAHHHPRPVCGLARHAPL